MIYKLMYRRPAASISVLAWSAGQMTWWLAHQLVVDILSTVIAA